MAEPQAPATPVNSVPNPAPVAPVAPPAATPVSAPDPTATSVTPAAAPAPAATPTATPAPTAAPAGAVDFIPGQPVHGPRVSSDPTQSATLTPAPAAPATPETTASDAATQPSQAAPLVDIAPVSSDQLHFSSNDLEKTQAGQGVNYFVNVHAGSLGQKLSEAIDRSQLKALNDAKIKRRAQEAEEAKKKEAEEAKKKEEDAKRAAERAKQLEQASFAVGDSRVDAEAMRQAAAMQAAREKKAKEEQLRAAAAEGNGIASERDPEKDKARSFDNGLGGSTAAAGDLRADVNLSGRLVGGIPGAETTAAGGKKFKFRQKHAYTPKPSLFSAWAAKRKAEKAKKAEEKSQPKTPKMKKDSPVGLILAIVAVVLLIGGGVAAFIILNQPQATQPTETQETPQTPAEEDPFEDPNIEVSDSEDPDLFVASAQSTINKAITGYLDAYRAANDGECGGAGQEECRVSANHAEYLAALIEALISKYQAYLDQATLDSTKARLYIMRAATLYQYHNETDAPSTLGAQIVNDAIAADAIEQSADSATRVATYAAAFGDVENDTKYRNLASERSAAN